ncbi:MAG: 30S ribosomal protein S8 [Verrucomicrobia bacterium]|nr:30S ribosomal protein S8 [Verrucomicrobiota bacterium]
MNITDSIGDMLTRIRNASAALKPEVKIPHSNLKTEIARILKKEGYVTDFAVVQEDAHKQIQIQLKFSGKTPAIEGIKRVSRPGRRVYVGSEEMPRVQGGMGTALVSTSRGIMTGNEARKFKVGGELLCTVW